MKKRILAGLLIAVLIALVVPFGAFAASYVDPVLEYAIEAYKDVVNDDLGLTGNSMQEDFCDTWYSIYTEDWYDAGCDMLNSDGSWNDEYTEYYYIQYTQMCLYYDYLTWDELIEYIKARYTDEQSGSDTAADVLANMTDDTPVMTGELFNAIVDRVNGYYRPAETTDKQIVSIQHPIYPSYSADGYGWKSSNRGFIPFRLGSDLFLGQDLSEIWVFPFVKNDDDLYYGQVQVRLYHQVDTDAAGNNVVCVYADVYDNINDTEKLGILITDDVASYPYMCLQPLPSWQWAFSVKGFADYSKFISFGSSSSLGGVFGSSYYSNLINPLDITDVVSFDYNDSSFAPIDNPNDDIGFYVSSEKFDIGFIHPLPAVTDAYYVTIQGDTVYDYSITNPDTGETTTIYNYTTNNYTFPEGSGGGDDGGSGSGGSVSGDVNVSGNIDVGGSVDININVNDDDGGYAAPDVDLTESLPEAPQNFITYLEILFGGLPVEIVGLIVAGITVAIFCRVWGR